mmetsp:Transcript_12834/g.20956  ORF Transcript_12834/g.20956 Transcript_12834/m.20956 type:complete len:80 (-) Transcript_12834:621-860(-)
MTSMASPFRAALTPLCMHAFLKTDAWTKPTTPSHHTTPYGARRFDFLIVYTLTSTALQGSAGQGSGTERTKQLDNHFSD